MEIANIIAGGIECKSDTIKYNRVKYTVGENAKWNMRNKLLMYKYNSEDKKSSKCLLRIIGIKSGISFYNAWMTVKERRELADPHPGFISQIKEYIKYSNI